MSAGLDFLTECRGWLIDAFPFALDDEEVGGWDDDAVLRAVDRHYDGGTAQARSDILGA